MRAVVWLTLLWAWTAFAGEVYPRSSADRPLTLAQGGVLVGANGGVHAWFRTDFSSFGGTSVLPVGDPIIKAGLFRRVELTLPLLLTVSIGDRSASESPELAIFGGVHRFRPFQGFIMPTIGASARRRVGGVTYRGDVEARGTTPLRLGPIGGFYRASAVALYAMTEGLTLAGGVSADVALRGPGFSAPLGVTGTWLTGKVFIGGTEDVPLVRWSAAKWVDFDLHAQFAPLFGAPELRAGVGVRFLFNMQREASPPSEPATQDASPPPTERDEAL